jgi:hypothetical protein
MSTEQPITQEYVDQLRKSLKQAEESRTYWFEAYQFRNTRNGNTLRQLGEVLKEIIDSPSTLEALRDHLEDNLSYFGKNATENCGTADEFDAWDIALAVASFAK